MQPGLTEEERTERAVPEESGSSEARIARERSPFPVLGTLPYFDEERGRLLSILLLYILGICALLLGITLTIPDLSGTVIILFTLASFAASYFLLARGRLTSASLLLALAVVIALTVNLYQSGVHDHANLFYPVVIIYAGLLLGRRIGALVATLVAVPFLLLVYLEATGRVTLPASQYTDFIDSAIIGVAIFSAAALAWIVMGAFERTLQRMGDRDRELAETNTRLAEQAASLTASEGRWRSLVKGVPDQIMSLRPDGSIQFSGAGDRGDGDAPETIFDLVHPSARRPLAGALAEAIGSGEIRSLEARDRTGRNCLSIRLSPVREEGVSSLTAIVADISERRRLEEQLHQAQKMEALGQLAGGVAHDFNNILTVISGHTSLLESQLGDKGSSDSLDEIQRAQERAASLTRQLLAFGRQQVLQPKIVELNEVVLGTESMLRRLIGEHIEIELQLDPSSGRILADPSKIEQALVNLAVNARDAMPNGGKLRIETGRQAGTDTGTPGAEEQLVALTVEDQGCGMDEATQAHMFEPFFTTKPRGKGTGLGLATVYGIVSQSGGRVEVESKVGEGTRITLLLPREESEAPQPSGDSEAEEVEGGDETVLLVEDDPSMRRLLTRILSRLGYRVLQAAGGEEALEVARDSGNAIDLLITDLVMPGIGGRSLVKRFRLQGGTAPVLYMSGYSYDAAVQDLTLEEGDHFLQKPFGLGDIGREVRQILDRAGD